MDVTEAHYLILNPQDTPAGVSGLLVDVRVPLAAGSARGVAVNSALDRSLQADLSRALRPRGRYVAPVGLTIPEGLTEIVRDAREWVAEATGPATAPVQLQRRP
jgi:hypothetical protein